MALECQKPRSTNCIFREAICERMCCALSVGFFEKPGAETLAAKDMTEFVKQPAKP